MPSEEINTVHRHLFDFRDGKIVRWQNFDRPADAFESAGIPREA